MIVFLTVFYVVLLFLAIKFKLIKPTLFWKLSPILWMVLLLIALVIAALGIATTLTVLVLERSRQLNTLLAIGAGFGQIRSMIFWEAAFLVVAGELAGIVCGFILSYLLVYVINRQSFGWTFLYGVDWGTLGMSLPLIILTALAAALPAVKMVFRQPPATLLRE